MGRYLIRRIGFTVLVLLVVSLLTFLIFVKLPTGDPARRATGRASTPEQIANARKAFGLDQPLWVQYGRFAKGLIPLPGLFLSEDVYYSYGNFIPVREEIARRLPVTVALALGGAALWLLIGIPVGIAAGVRRKSSMSRFSMLIAIIGVSIPVFWLGQLLLYIFWFRLGWAPPSGMDVGVGVWGSVLDGRFLLPWITVAVGYAAFYARMVRSNVIETMHEDYIRTARAKGLPERGVIYRHGLRGALTPVVTMLGLDLGTLLGGLFIVETLFGLPGVGQLAVTSIATNDFPMVMGVTVLGALFIAVANLVVDVAYAALDPRVRYT
ncbi:MAG TPA: ABC transporter permease [Actinomycetota bacterium]|nr:ABC transporter permease [Actinomycetota bacterium]